MPTPARGGRRTTPAACYLPGAARRASRRIDALTTVNPVPGRVIAVLKDVSTDEDGETVTRHTPVVAFTTHEGTAVTAYRTSDLPDPAGSYGQPGRRSIPAASPATARPGAKAPK